MTNPVSASAKQDEGDERSADAAGSGSTGASSVQPEASKASYSSSVISRISSSI